MGTITSNDPGIGAQEMKVKGTFIMPDGERWSTSKYLFLSDEEEKAFFKNNPNYAGYVDIEESEPQAPKTIRKNSKKVTSAA